MGLNIGILAPNLKLAECILNEILSVEESEILFRMRNRATLKDGTTYFAFSNPERRGRRFDQLFIVDGRYEEDLRNAQLMLLSSCVPDEYKVQIINLDSFYELDFETEYKRNYDILWGKNGQDI